MSAQFADKASATLKIAQRQTKAHNTLASRAPQKLRNVTRAELAKLNIGLMHLSATAKNPTKAPRLSTAISNCSHALRSNS